MTTSPDLPDISALRKALRSSSRGPLKPKELARSLEVPRTLYREFKDLLRAHEEAGRLYRIRGNRYAIPEKINLTIGKLQVIRSGDGFVRPEEGGDDVFVPSALLDSAMDGDRVAARIEGRTRGKGPHGRVLKILDRGRPTIVGTYRSNKSFGFVVPLDRRAGRDVLIPQGDQGGARSGDVVVVRITQFGSNRVNSVGDVEKVLGPMSAPGVDVLSILHGHGLHAEFPRKVEEVAATSADRMGEPGPRTDRRDLRTFTIDPADAKDHDDALSVTALGDEEWEVGIHIADVSHFVEEGTELDLEALRRGTSVYLVNQVVPMLPHTLSSDLCSLREGEDRLALSLFVHLDGQARVRRHRFEKSWIRIRKGLNYEQVQEVLDGAASIEPATDEALLTLNRIASVLRSRRRSRGSLDFDLPEARVVLNESGDPMDIQKVTQLASHRLVEDFMLLANEVVAAQAVERHLPVPFRIHEPPASSRLEELKAFLASVGHTLPRGDIGAQTLQQVLERVQGRAEETLVSTVILRSMQKARYDPVNVGHFGLASPAYAHFTSPIRRYPDLVVHRVLSATLTGDREVPERWGGEHLEEVCERSSEQERKAQQAERDSVDLKKIEFMERHLGDDFAGTIAGVTSFGFFVLLDEFFVEGLVHVSSLGDDYYRFIAEAHTLAGERNGRRFRVGDRVRVQVVRTDREERKIDFLLLESLPVDRTGD
ncbi:MAG: ribonuclease R [Gemmatimonadota bacterium]